MKRPTALEAGIVLVALAIAGSFVRELITHRVSGDTVIAVAGFTLSAGLLLAAYARQVRTTRLFRCPVAGCSLTVRVQDGGPGELKRGRELAVDHRLHGATRS